MGRDERMLHLHRFDNREALAGFDLFPLPDRKRHEAAVHRSTDHGVAFLRAALSLCKRVNELDERLSAANEGIGAAIRFIERDFIASARAAAVSEIGVGGFDEMQARRDPVDGGVEAYPAHACEFE